MKDASKWLELLSDEACADVMKAQVAAEAATEQVRIKEVESTRRCKLGCSGYHWVKVWIACAVVASLVVAFAVGHHDSCHKEVELARIAAEHPARCARK